MPKTIKRSGLLFCLLFSLIGRAASPGENWDNLCARCHGAIGDGKTKQGVKLKCKDYTDPKVQAAFTDVGLLKNTMLGIEDADGVFRMPFYKDKLTVAEAKELIVLIRSFRK